MRERALFPGSGGMVVREIFGRFISRAFLGVGIFGPFSTKMAKLGMINLPEPLWFGIPAMPAVKLFAASR